MAEILNDFSYKSQNLAMQEALKTSISNIFPLTNKNKQLLVKNIHIDDKLGDFDFPEQRNTKLGRQTWQMPIYADFELIDLSTGKTVDKMLNKKIGNLPKITNRYTTIIDGNEYQTTNQFRRKSGVYSRIKKNGELEAEFNLAKGKNFKMMLDPISGIFYLIFANRKYRVWTLLNILGATDKQLQTTWGNDLLETNKKGAFTTEDSELKSIYTILYNKAPKSLDETIAGLRKYFTDSTEMDGAVNKLTLGEAFTKVNIDSLLATSKQLLDINKGADVPDERDSLLFKDLYTIDDLVTSYFAKNSKIIKTKLERSLGLRERIKDVVTPATFSDPIKKFFTVGDLSSTPPQTNPVTIIAETRKTTPMGSGGIESSHAVTEDMRNLHPSHLGFLDGTASPESSKIGITLGLASEIRKKGKNLYTPVRDLDNNLHWFSPLDIYENVIGFPDQFKIDEKTNKVKPISDMIKVMKNNTTTEVPANEVKYYLRSPKTMFSIQTNLIPFLDSTQGNRASTGARMITQALPLVNPDKPIVETKRDSVSTFEMLAGHSLGPNSESDGIVTSIDENYIYVKNNDGKSVKYGMYKDFPLNQDGFVNSYPIVKVGDKVKSGDLLAGNNYTVGDKLALSKNLNVGFLSYKGLNFEDGIVVTEGAAKKLTHETIHKENIYFSPKITLFNKDKFNAWFPDMLTTSNFNKLGSDGIIKKGQRVVKDDIIAAYLVEKEMSDLDNALKKLDKITFNKYDKKILRWENDDAGVITDVQKIGRNIDIYIKAQHPLKEGDKLSALHGNKGIVTKIIPDDEAPHRSNGEPIEVMMSAEGVPGRMNIGQILTTTASKIADKEGKSYLVNNFDDPNDDQAKILIDKANKAGIEIDEYLTDGKNGPKILKPIFVGKQPIIKLRHIIDKKIGSTSIGAYDVYEQPAGKGAQNAGALDVYAYIGHGARNNLEEMSTIKGRKNEEYWRNLQFGLPPGKPARNFVWEKMIADLKGMGVNVDKNGSKVRIMPLTDHDIMAMSNGEVSDPGTLLIGKNLLAKKGGLFDKEITGGAKGTSWSHFNLATRIPNPMFEDAIIKLLGLTENKYENIIKGVDKLNEESGVGAIVNSLKKIKVKDLLESKKAELKIAPETNVNKLNTTIKYLQALDELNMTAFDAYTLSKLPVIPPQFRPIYPLPSGDLMISDINKHYKDVGVINNGLKANLKEGNLTTEKEIEVQGTLYDTVKALQGIIDPLTYSQQKYKGFLKEFGKVKTGTVHGRAWARSQDLSGRSTITVEPDLNIDEVGIPQTMAYNMWKPLIIRELKSYGLKAAEAKKQYDENSSLAKKALQSVASDRPIILNRAPSLHKHSVQAFKPILVEGQSIRLNPLIFSGFNSDLDGDTMSIMTPIGSGAVEEALDMMPSKILFKHGDNALVPELSKDYIFGLYQASLLGSDTGKVFSKIEDAKKEKLGMTDIFSLGGKKMSIGQYYINLPLPDELKDYTRTMSKKESSKLLTEIGRKYPSYFSDVISSWKNIGYNYAYKFGHTISINDFNIDKSFREKLLKENLPKIQKLKTKEEKIKAYNDLTIKMQEEQNKILQSSNNNLKNMINSGSFTKTDSIRQILTAPGVLLDLKGQPVEIPVFKSYGEGLDTASFFNSLYAVRKGTVDRAVNTQDTGALTKSLLSVTRRTIITEEDCNTNKSIKINIDSKDVLDRFSAITVPGVIKRNELVTSDTIIKARKQGVVELAVRSPLTCEAVNGICQKCYGLTPDGKEASIGLNVGTLDSQALTERSTQLTMRTFHCFEGSNIVQTENGELRTIRDIVNSNYRGKLLDRPNEFVEVVNTNKHLPTDKLYLVQSKNGTKIIAQGNHPIQYRENTKRCYYCDSARIKLDGDKYNCSNCFSKFEKNKVDELSSNFETKEISKLENSKDALLTVPFESNFGSVDWDWGVDAKTLAKAYHNYSYFKGLDDATKKRLMSECGPRPNRFVLPKNILNYPVKDVQDLIFGILKRNIAGELERKIKRRKKGYMYLFSTVHNFGLASQIKFILNKFGVRTKVKYVKKYGYHYYRIVLSNIQNYTFTKVLNGERYLIPFNPIEKYLNNRNYYSRKIDYLHKHNDDQYVYDIETKTGTLTVNEMWVHNSGGSALAGGGVLEGFPNIKRLLQVPEKLANKSTLSTVSGVVQTVSQNSVGGYDIYINNIKHITLPGQKILVQSGTMVKKGDQLSTGMLKPQELGELTDHLTAQQYIVDEMNKVFENKFTKKTFETVVRGVSDNAEIVNAPDDVDFIRGDKTTISYINHLNKQRLKEGLDLIEYKPYFKSIETLNVDNSDWMTKITTNRIKAAIRTGAAKGQFTNLSGTDPIPAYIYGDDFAKTRL